MDLALQIAVGILIAIGIAAWFGGYKIVGIWFFFAGCVGVLFVIALHIQTDVRRARVAATSTPIPDESTEVARRKERSPHISIEPIENNAAEWKRGGVWFQWSYRITNYGETNAIIKEVQDFAAIAKTGPTITVDKDRVSGTKFEIFPQSARVQNLHGKTVLKSGESFDFTVTADGPISALVTPDRLANQPAPFQQMQKDALAEINLPLWTADGTTRFWLAGIISYEDIVGDLHQSRFRYRGTAGITSPPGYEEAGGDEYNHRD